jgi:hypothetical protein
VRRLPSRLLKVLVVPALALGITGFSSAPAALAVTEFHPEAAGQFVHGEQVAQNTFTFNARVVKCETATYAGGPLAAAAAELTITPVYGGCEGAGLATEWKMNGCDYVFHLNNGGPPFEGPMAIKCPAGAQMEFNIGGGACIVKVEPQERGKVVYVNGGAGANRTVRFDLSVVNLKVTVAGAVLICGANGARFGDLGGSVLMKGNNAANTGGAQVGFWVE